MAELVLTPQVFAILNGLVEDAAGISCSLSELELFASKVGARVSEAGFESFLDYYYFLRYDEAGKEELERLIETLVVHETFFFRELGPLQALVERYVQPWVAAGRKVRIWCAACATGEEPRTLAMLLADKGLLPHVELVASDVSARVLERAKAGEYSVRALRRGLIPVFARPYLEVVEERVKVAPEISAAIQWRQVNLIDQASIQAVGAVDAIVCRNVLIYFRDELVRRVVATLSALLAPDGALLIGVSESLMRLGTGLSCEEQAGAFFYRKPENS